MALKIWREWRFPVEFALLLALLFFLPLREAPKNLFWLAYVVTWLVNRIRSGEWGGRWDGWDSLIVAWLASGYLAAAFAGIRTPEANEWWAVNDLVRYTSLLFCIRRARYSEQQCVAILTMLLGSCVIGTLEGIWHWRVTGKRKWIELVSVGHVNHSAIYIAICMGVGAGLLIAKDIVRSRSNQALIGTFVFFLLASLFAGESRAAVLAAVLLLLVIVVLGTRRRKAGVVVWIAMAVLIVASALLGGTRSIDRQVQNMAANNVLSERDLIWNRAIVAARAAPWFGVGMDNFSRITDERLRRWVHEQGRTVVDREFARAPHAHSLYFNTLTERGVVGLAILLAVMSAWAVALVRRFPRSDSSGEMGVIWFASFSGWFISAAIGLVNTTMHHEHAMLAIVVLGLLLSRALEAKGRGLATA